MIDLSGEVDRGQRTIVSSMADASADGSNANDARPLDPVDAYKKHVDITLIREQLRRTPDERVERMMAALRLAEELRAAARRARR